MDLAAVAIWAAVPFTVETSENTLTLAFAARAWLSVVLNSGAYWPLTVVFDSSWSRNMSPEAAAAPAMSTRTYHWLTDSPRCRGRTEPGTVPRSSAGAWMTFSPWARASWPNKAMYLTGFCRSPAGVADQFSGSYMTHL